MKPVEPTPLFRIKSLVNDFVQDAVSLDGAKCLAKYNFPKGYEIISIHSGELIERWEHFCSTCKKCSDCKHLYSEHSSDHKLKCTEKKCNCKEFKE